MRAAQLEAGECRFCLSQVRRIPDHPGKWVLFDNFAVLNHTNRAMQLTGLGVREFLLLCQMFSWPTFIDLSWKGFLLFVASDGYFALLSLVLQLLAINRAVLIPSRDVRFCQLLFITEGQINGIRVKWKQNGRSREIVSVYGEKSSTIHRKFYTSENCLRLK